MNNKRIFIMLIFLSVSFFAQAAIKTPAYSTDRLTYDKCMLNTVLFDLHRISCPDTNSKNNPYSKVLEKIYHACNTQIIFYTNKQDEYSLLMEDIFKGLKNAAILRNQINIDSKKNNIPAEESCFYPYLKEQTMTTSNQIGILFEKRITSTTADGSLCVNRFSTSTFC